MCVGVCVCEPRCAEFCVYRTDCPSDSWVRTPNFVGHPARPDLVSGVIRSERLEMYDYTPQQYAALSHLIAAVHVALPRIRLDCPRDNVRIHGCVAVRRVSCVVCLCALVAYCVYMRVYRCRVYGVSCYVICCESADSTVRRRRARC